MKIIISLLVAVLSLQANGDRKLDFKVNETKNNVVILGSFMWQDEPYTYFEKQARYDKRNYEKVQTWKSAIRYCQKLSLAGYSDWRLPSRSEITSIVDKSRKPTIKKEFKNALATFYWTSTAHESLDSDAWFVQFSNGIANNTYKSRTHYVRCIREIQ